MVGSVGPPHDRLHGRQRRHDAQYPGGTDPGASAARLLLPTLADELRAQRSGARVATVALKARSAIMLAGHGGDAVTWMDEDYQEWQTSTAFTPQRVAGVQALLAANPVDADFGKSWTRRLPVERYQSVDEGEGEAPPRGWSAAFPHVLQGNNDKAPGRDFRGQWARSPFADAWVGRYASAVADSLQLGRDDQTDFLGVSFSTPDLVGHAFGPLSQEVQDIYAHLDVTIGILLDHLDALVGRDRYVVALTADHGVSLVPENSAVSREEAGRVSTARIAEQLERAAQAAAAGSGSYIARVNGSDVYFTDGSFERLTKTPAALNAVVAALESYPGVGRVFRREQLLGGADSADPLLRAAALSYVPRASGDLLFAVRPGWVSVASGTTHGTANLYDQRVPIIFMGPGIRPGEYPRRRDPGRYRSDAGVHRRRDPGPRRGTPPQCHRLAEALISRRACWRSSAAFRTAMSRPMGRSPPVPAVPARRGPWATSCGPAAVRTSPAIASSPPAAGSAAMAAAKCSSASC